MQIVLTFHPPLPLLTTAQFEALLYNFIIILLQYAYVCVFVFCKIFYKAIFSNICTYRICNVIFLAHCGSQENMLQYMHTYTCLHTQWGFAANSSVWWHGFVEWLAQMKLGFHTTVWVCMYVCVCVYFYVSACVSICKF